MHEETRGLVYQSGICHSMPPTLSGTTPFQSRLITDFPVYPAKDSRNRKHVPSDGRLRVQEWLDQSRQFDFSAHVCMEGPGYDHSDIPRREEVQQCELISRGYAPLHRHSSSAPVNRNIIHTPIPRRNQPPTILEVDTQQTSVWGGWGVVPIPHFKGPLPAFSSSHRNRRTSTQSTAHATSVTSMQPKADGVPVLSVPSLLASAKPSNISANSTGPHPRQKTRPYGVPPLKVADVQPTFATGFGEHSESPEHHFFNDVPFPPSRATSPSVPSGSERACSPIAYDTFSWPPRPSTPTPHSLPNVIIDQSGRRSAPGWYSAKPRPEVKQNLHRYVFKHKILPPSDPPKGEKVYNEKKQFRVCVEDDDNSATLVHEFRPSNHTQTTINNSQFRSGLTSAVPLVSETSPMITQLGSTFVTHEDTGPHLPSFDFATHNLDDPEMDNYVVSSASAYKPTEAGSPSMANNISYICNLLVTIFRDLSRYKKFLSYRDKRAQCLLNFLQTLMDYSLLEDRFRVILFVALLRLSRKSELYPQCFTLTDVTREGDPVTDGHYGEIYKGHLHGRVICLKVMKLFSTSDPIHIHKVFSREAVLWGQLSHPNVLPFYGIFSLGDTRNRIGLVSPWMPNGNINDYLKKHPLTNRILLIWDIVTGLIYLHKNRVVHGDLKGANILVNVSGRACLADFGLSSVTDAHGLRNKELSSDNNIEGGTVRFQAPELIDTKFQCRKNEASDVYAFSMVCYEIFTGDYPFSQIESNYTIILKVTRGERPSRPSGLLYLDRGMDDRMWRLMEDCWEHIPTNRPTTAFQISERLPQGVKNVDPRGPDGWDDLAPPRFRAADAPRGQPNRPDGSMTEAIHAMKMNGISLFQF